jgi:hypothetical protein
VSDAKPYTSADLSPALNFPRVDATVEALEAAQVQIAELRWVLEQEDAKQKEATAEAAECVEFLRNLNDWHEFWQDGFLGSKQKAATRENAQKLRAFLDETNHARRFVERLDAERVRAEHAEAALAKLQQTREMDLGTAALLERAERAEALNAQLRGDLVRIMDRYRPTEFAHSVAASALALRDATPASSLVLKFNGGDAVFLWEGSGSKRLAEFDLLTRTEAEAYGMRVAEAVRAACVTGGNSYWNIHVAALDLAEVVKGVK